MVLPARFELATLGLKGPYSAVELQKHVFSFAKNGPNFLEFYRFYKLNLVHPVGFEPTL